MSCNHVNAWLGGSHFTSQRITHTGLTLALRGDVTQVTGAHFDDLRQRYGHPLVVLNLLKSREKRGREVVLRRELATAVSLLNAQVWGPLSPEREPLTLKETLPQVFHSRATVRDSNW